MKDFLLLATVLLILQTSIAQTSYTWNGSVSSSWTTPGNWTPNGVPGGADEVKIVTAGNICILNVSTTISNIDLTSGTLDLNTATLTINGTSAVFSSGTVQNGDIVVTAANTTSFGTGTVAMNCDVHISTATISIRNTTFQRLTDITKTGSSNDGSNGNNTFYGPTTITNAGTGYLILANTGADSFIGPATFNNTGGNNLYIANNGSNNLFSGVTSFNNAPSANTGIYIGWYSPGVQFNNDIIVSSTSGNGIFFCGGNAAASAQLASGHSIGIGINGFSSGILSLRHFTQSGSIPVNLSTTANSEVWLGPSGNFGGAVTISSPNIYASTSVFNSPVILTKTDGSSSNASSGGNTFNADLTVNYFSSTGTGYWSFGNGAADIYNGDVYSNNNSQDRIIFGHNSVGNQFNGNFIVTQRGASRGTALTWNNGASAAMAAGKTIAIGATGFSAGYFYIQGFTQNGSVPVNLTTTGSSSIFVGAGSAYNPSVIGGSFSVTSPDIYVRGATFNSSVSFTKTGGTSNHNDGKQNTFNGNLSITQQSNSGYFMLGYNADDQFNGNITVSSTGTGGISIGWTNGTGKPVLATGKTISVGAGGYSAGYLQLGGFTQTGTDPINLTLTGTSSFIVVNPGTPCSFNGPLSVSAPDIYLRGGIFNGTSHFTKTGGISNHNDGKQNIFNGTLSINQQSSTGYFMLGYNSSDLFNDDITVSSTGSGGIYLGYATGSGTPALAATKTIFTGIAGFSNGFLSLNNFTQLGSAPMNLAFTGTNTALRFGHNSVIGGNLHAISPDLYFDGCTFNGTVDATKTGGGSNLSRGGNVFNRRCNITNNGSGYFLLGNTDPDTWNDDVVFTNTGSERILPCWSSAGNQFNGNIYLNTGGSADGIHFCGGNNTATATLAAGKTIANGISGLNSGYVILKQFTQLGTTAVSLTLNSGATFLQFGPSSSFGGNVQSSSPRLYLNGCTFSGAVNATKSGAGNDASTGNNIFNGNTIISNSGNGYLMLGNGNADQFNSNATFNNTGDNNLFVAYNSSNNIFGGTVTFNNFPSGNFGIYVSSYSNGTLFKDDIIAASTKGQGVQFCTGNTSASATLNSGKTISISGSGFSAGILLLKQFIQLGATAQNLTLTGTGRLSFGHSSVFGGAVTSSSPSLNFDGTTFNDAVHATKTGTTNDQSAGNNVFNGNAVFNNTGTGYLLMSISSPDIYKGNVGFIKSSSGLIYPNYNHSSTYAGDINISSSTAVTFGAGTGTAIVNGTGTQNISVTPGTPTPVFTRLEVNNTGSGVTLSNTPINVSKSLVLTSGLLHTSATNILTMQNTSAVAAGNALSTSNINGPMRYQKAIAGVSTLNFPIGNGSDCRPVSLTVNHSNGVLYTYQTQLFNASAAALGYSLPPLTDSVSSVHYYTIERTDALGNNQPVAGLSGNQTIEIFFGSNDLITDGGRITVVKNTYNNPTGWVDIGGIGGPPYAGGANLTGSITSTSAPASFNSFSTFAIGFRKLVILPVELVDFSAKPNNNMVDIEWTTAFESGNQFFTIERSRDGTDFEFVKNVSTQANGGNSQVKIYYAASDNHPYTGRSFYRIKQTDINGKFSYTKIVSVNFDKKTSVTVYPNPAANTIYIKGLNITTTQVEWYDISGRILVTQSVPVENGIARVGSNLTEGIYILKYTTANGVWGSQRIIIRR